MKPTVLLATTVHSPDDTRIRERLIRTLIADFRVVFAARSPGPSDPSGLEFSELRGGRLRRNINALGVVLSQRWDALIVPDPELLPVALLGRFVKRRPVVFDVHEDYLGLVETRSWIPNWLRLPLRGALKLAVWAARRFLTITLAESGYQRFYGGDGVVFPNHPDTSRYPPVLEERRDEVVYLGDATHDRGVDLAAAACGDAGLQLRVIGRVSNRLREELAPAAASGPGLSLEGPLPNPEALKLAAGAAVAVVPLRDRPNYRYSQPTKVLEYLALGIPVVASDLPGTRQLVEGLESVTLVPEGDREAMAAAIVSSSRPERRAKAIEQAELVRERYRWPSEEVRAFYRSVVGM